MKRKVYLAALVMCMALAVNGCGSDKETTSTESESTATEQQAEDSAGRKKRYRNLIQILPVRHAWFQWIMWRNTLQLQTIRG